MTTLDQVDHPHALDLDLLGGRDGAVALHTASGAVTYGELADLVTREAARLGPERRVVVLEARNDVETVVRLLAAWAGHHPVLLLGADDAGRHGETVARYADVAPADLHPDLALLLSTSGSTGSPKLVRLSRANVLANARSIADYLALTSEDRAITSLPLHYCYGLSVLTSHLVVGAGVVLTDLSVADECFWDLAVDRRATSLAGVPYTFDLLDAARFTERDLPDLRYVTQAGGRLAPETVRRYARLGARRGWDLVVMYGATEATARMAYLPPRLAATHPGAIGVPVPGGRFHLEPVAGLDLADDTGELVYTGPNVMMGYALEAADLARGAELAELRTGDLARCTSDGLWEVRGRLDQHVKVFGLRVDLARVERSLPVPTTVVAYADRLHCFVDRPRRTRSVRAAVVEATGLPPSAVAVHVLAAIPTTERGKVDRAALREHAARADSIDTGSGTGTGTDAPHGPATAETVRDLYAVLLGRPRARVEDSFADLGGDSLSFVEASTRLASLLGALPRGWQHLSPLELAGHARRRRGLTALVEVPTALRALAILAIVLSHTDLWMVMGGAHVLLAVGGYNLARFALHVDGRSARVRRVVGSLATFAVPASLWILVTGAVTDDYEPATAFYLNQLVGSDTWTGDWQFWFLEVLVWGYLALAALLAVPVVDRHQRAHPFAVAVTAAALAIGLRYALVGRSTESLEEYTIGAALFCVTLGWAAAEARTTLHRVVVLALTLAGLWGYFGEDPQRQLVTTVGIGLLVVTRPLPLPAVLVRCVVALAHASFWIYLTHWQVYWPLEEAGHRVLAAVASIVVGLATARLYAGASRRVRRLASSSP